MVVTGWFVVLPAIPFVVIAGVATSVVGISRAGTQRRAGEAAVRLTLCVLGGIGFLVASVWP